MQSQQDQQDDVEQTGAAGEEILADLQPGDPVRIHEGPFTGYQAVFDAYLPDHERARVQLRLLDQYQLMVELPVSEIERL